MSLQEQQPPPAGAARWRNSNVSGRCLQSPCTLRRLCFAATIFIERQSSDPPLAPAAVPPSSFPLTHSDRPAASSLPNAATKQAGSLRGCTYTRRHRTSLRVRTQTDIQTSASVPLRGVCLLASVFSVGSMPQDCRGLQNRWALGGAAATAFVLRNRGGSKGSREGGNELDVDGGLACPPSAAHLLWL